MDSESAIRYSLDLYLLDGLVANAMEDLEHYEGLVNEAMKRGDWEAAAFHAKRYHRTAERILHETGIDPRSRA